MCSTLAVATRSFDATDTASAGTDDRLDRFQQRTTSCRQTEAVLVRRSGSDRNQAHPDRQRSPIALRSLPGRPPQAGSLASVPRLGCRSRTRDSAQFRLLPRPAPWASGRAPAFSRYRAYVRIVADDPAVTSRKLVSQLSAVDAPYATWSSFPVVAVGLVVSSAMEASLR